jgi:hypothetical protein
MAFPYRTNGRVAGAIELINPQEKNVAVDEQKMFSNLVALLLSAGGSTRPPAASSQVSQAELPKPAVGPPAAVEESGQEPAAETEASSTDGEASEPAERTEPTEGDAAAPEENEKVDLPTPEPAPLETRLRQFQMANQVNHLHQKQPLEQRPAKRKWIPPVNAKVNRLPKCKQIHRLKRRQIRLPRRKQIHPAKRKQIHRRAKRRQIHRRVPKGRQVKQRKNLTHSQH